MKTELEKKDGKEDVRYLLTVGQTAEMLAIARQTLYNWLAANTCPIPVKRIGKRAIRFRLSDVLNYLDEGC